MLHEPTTTITNFILCLETLILAALLATSGHAFPSLPYWTATFVLLGIAALLGGLAHGLARPSLFVVIYLCLAITMATFVLAALIDCFGFELGAWAHWAVAALAFIFFLTARRYPTYILAYAVLVAAVMLLALIVYLWLEFARGLPGAGYLTAGIATIVAATALLLKKVQVTIVWTFDHNGLYHLMLMAGMLLFYLGLNLRASGTY